MTFNLTAENERGLSQLSYWRRGSKSSKTWILNQALAEYLSRYPDSQRDIPVDDDE
jgi:predicted transcriptional regulator